MAPAQQYYLKHYGRCMAACFLISMSPFQYGTDFGLIGGLQAMVGFLKIFGYPDPETPIGWNISTVAQQLIGSLMTIGAFAGSMTAGYMSIWLGRRQCLWAACLLCAASDAIMMGTKSLGGLYAGRLLIGIANGWLMTFGQLYLQEVAPARYRGMAIAMFNVWTSVGSLVGTVIDNFTAPIDGRNCYLIPLGIIYVIPAIITVGLFFIPESPRWLVSRGRNEEALKALKWLRPDGDTSVEAEYAEIELVHRQEREGGKGVGWVDLFRDPIDRRRTLIAVGSVSTQAACGVFFMIAYGTYFFEMAGIGDPFRNSCILSAVGVIAIMVTVGVIVPYGRRRPFMMTGLIICGFTQIIVAAVYQVHPGSKSTGKVIVAVSTIYLVAYNCAISSFAWLVGGEVPSQRLRSYTFGLSAGVGFLGAWLAAFTAPYFINPASLNWGPKYGYIWFPSCLIAAAFVYFFIPETKDRTQEEIHEMFVAGVPSRKFKGYQCTIHDEVQHKINIPLQIGVIPEKIIADASVEVIEHAHGHDKV